MTTYIILRREEVQGVGDTATRWSEIAPGSTMQASSARRALAALDLKDGEYVAVPVRSWRPLTVKVEQTTKVTIG